MKEHPKKPHRPCYCKLCMADRYNQPCAGCPEGHASFWKTVIESQWWKEWKAFAWEEKMLYDFPEVEELGVISPEHFADFIKFVILTNKIQ